MSYQSRPHGFGRAHRAQRQSLGDAVTPSTSRNVEQLQRQLNRYTSAGGAPLHMLVASQPLQITGMLDHDTAQRAVWILAYRAGAAQVQWHDQDSQKLIAEANSAWSDPVAFVNRNLARVTKIVTLFADKSGLPAPKGLPIGLTPTMITAALVVGGLLLVRRFP